MAEQVMEMGKLLRGMRLDIKERRFSLIQPNRIVLNITANISVKNLNDIKGEESYCIELVEALPNLSLIV